MEWMVTPEHQLMAVTPIDGRYSDRLGNLSQYASEFGLIKARAGVMAGWVGVLGSGILPDREPLSDVAHEHLTGLARNMTVADAQEVKEIERTTNHDVKAVEMWLTGKLAGPDYEAYRTLVHFGCTSEDVNSAAYGLMMTDVRQEELVPKLVEISSDLVDKSLGWAEIPMLALTHGQPATPTTLGKEMRVFSDRLDRQVEELEDVGIFAKFSGASGGYNAATFAYPEVDWPRVCRVFIERDLDLICTPVTGQIEPHDWIARFANELNQINMVLSDFSKDMWLYIMRGVLRQRMKEGEVGSSTMPHKVNPIDHENAEGNFDMAGAILQRLASSLPISRMQRDLSDSTRLRSLGPALAHSVVGYSSVLKGLGKILPDEQRLAEELDRNWAVLTEPVQTTMRRYGIEGAYDRIKKASRGQELTKDGYLALITELEHELPLDAYERLMALTPGTYIGRSAELAKGEL